MGSYIIKVIFEDFLLPITHKLMFPIFLFMKVLSITKGWHKTVLIHEPNAFEWKNIFHANLNCHSQVIRVQYRSFQVWQESKHTIEEKGNRVNLEPRWLTNSVERIYLLSDKVFIVFIPSRDIKLWINMQFKIFI